MRLLPIGTDHAGRLPLSDYPNPTDQDINAVMAGNLCRCMTYVCIRKAIKLAATRMRGGTAHG